MATNRQIIQKAYSYFNAGDIQSYGHLFSVTTKNHGIPVGRDGIIYVVSDILHTFPDLKLIPQDIFTDGDWVISRDIFKGTFKNKAKLPHHGGLLMTHEPNNKAFQVQHIHMFKLENGLITEHFACRDDIEMYQQLGLMEQAPVFSPQ